MTPPHNALKMDKMLDNALWVLGAQGGFLTSGQVITLTLSLLTQNRQSRETRGEIWMNKAFWKFPWEWTWLKTWNGWLWDICKDSSLYEWCLIISSEIYLNGNMARKMHSSNNGVQTYETEQQLMVLPWPTRTRKEIKAPISTQRHSRAGVHPGRFGSSLNSQDASSTTVLGFQLPLQEIRVRDAWLSLVTIYFFFSLGNILSQSRVILRVCFKHVLPW